MHPNQIYIDELDSFTFYWDWSWQINISGENVLSRHVLLMLVYLHFLKGSSLTTINHKNFAAIKRISD